MRIDFRFIEFGYEFEALRASVNLLQEHLPSIIDGEATRLYNEYDDDDEGSAAYFVANEIRSGLVPRSLTGASAYRCVGGV